MLCNVTALEVVKAAGFIIYRYHETVQFLLLQASYGEHHWTPPKGHLDKGEDEMKAAIRETQEESGLTKDDYTIDPEFFKTLVYPIRNKVKEVKYWLAEVKNGTEIVLSKEHQAYKWVTVPRARELMKKYKSMCDILGEAEEHIIKKIKKNKEEREKSHDDL